MTLEINGYNFTEFVVAGTYAVNRESVYSSWEDLAHVEHRSDVRRRVVGTFDMYFKNPHDYGLFAIQAYQQVRSDGTAYVICSVNNSNDTFKGYAFIEFAPVRSRTPEGVDYMEQFTVTIEENMR